jgi:hypothetical protein
MRIGKEIYLLECQSYDDDSMAIRLAEYAFISAGKVAAWGNGYANNEMCRLHAEGENALIELYATLKRLGREADADKAMTDPEARMRLYKEFMIGGAAGE